MSKQIADELLKEKESSYLQNSEFFDNDDKEYIYKNLTDETLKKERKNLSKQIDIKENWKTIKNKTNKPVKKMVFWRYAVAAVLIGVLISIDFLSPPPTISPLETNTLLVKSNGPITIGTEKATLTLEDGSSIELEKGKKFKTNTINSNGEKIVYKKPKEPKTAIQYNYLTIPRGGQYSIELSDGTYVWLNSESKLKFPVAFLEGEPRQVELIYGEAFFSVSSSTNHNGSKFKVINQAQVVEVFGTEFNIKAYKDETHIYTTLIEGKVTISNRLSIKQKLLPNQQSILNIESNNIEIIPINIENEIAWKHGVFSFKGKKLKDIMKVISRWYDVDVIFVDKALEDIKFKGVLGKEQNIEEILSSIQTLSIIKNYKIKGKTIILN
ncbi:FecR family protein [Flavicella sp.]|uniref:FecR family protein n=1 Tax=Flavicella sp. TaxID=2957742 RepID=UPI0030162175